MLNNTTKTIKKLIEGMTRNIGQKIKKLLMNDIDNIDKHRKGK